MLLKQSFHSPFTTHEVGAAHKIGAKVIGQIIDKQGFGYVVGYRIINTSTWATIAFFPKALHFIGSSCVPGCFTAIKFIEVSNAKD